MSYIYTVTNGKGQDFLFRYRAVNSIGNGPWSDYNSIKAASHPAQPNMPTYAASDSTSITLDLNYTGVDDGGNEISKFKLYRDAGSNTLGTGDINTLVAELTEVDT